MNLASARTARLAGAPVVGTRDVDACVGVVGQVDGHLVHPQPVVLGGQPTSGSDDSI
jgi:hypothetical protein